jgi:hypothetical protein
MKFKSKILLFAIIICSTYTFGQVVPPPIPPPPPPPPGLPIDGGLLFLFISGIILGVKKLKRN